MKPGLRSERRGPAVVVTLDRPERRNALTVALAGEVADAVADAAAGGACCVVLTGAPPAFCAGGDLDDLSAVAELGALEATDAIYANFHGLVRAITGAPIPIIAAVNGPALGAGLDLTLVCDIRIASTEAVFASSWVNLGLVPGMGGARLLPRLIGGARAAELLLTGARFSAAEALAWGLVSRVVEPGGLFPVVDELAERFAALPAGGVTRTKAALRRTLDDGLDNEFVALGATQGAILASAAFQKAAAPFRKPAPS